jgi:hypothetical protein
MSWVEMRVTVLLHSWHARNKTYGISHKKN